MPDGRQVFAGLETTSLSPHASFGHPASFAPIKNFCKKQIGFQLCLYVHFKRTHMLRPRVKKRRKPVEPLGAFAGVRAAASVQRDDKRRRPSSTGVGRLRSGLMYLLGSKRFRRHGVVFVSLIFIIMRWRASLGTLLDDIVRDWVVHRLGWVSESSSTARVSSVKHWPTVETRDRKTIQDYQNFYLETVLGRNTSYDFGSNEVPPVGPSSPVQKAGEMVMVDVPSSNSEWWQMYSLGARLARAKCYPGWWCRRCLSYPLAGSFSKCRSACSECFVKAVATTKTISLPALPIKQLPDRDMGTFRDDKNDDSLEYLRLIPRAIYHVGCFDEMPTMMSHPDWIRVQNTWRGQSRYEYHPFSTVNQQRLWIQRNYPTAFLSAFDFLARDRRQAQLFGLLILFRKGGIMAYSEWHFGNSWYSDSCWLVGILIFAAFVVDLVLETNLEKLLSVSGLSFVAAVDSRSSPYLSSLFPGFVAARSGHPVIGRAIMALMHLIAVEAHGSRDQMGETDAYLSRFFSIQSLELWRTKAAPQICPLGVAAHQTLDHVSPYVPLHLGLNSLTEKERALFLLVSVSKIRADADMNRGAGI